jgi:hypothetical protein
VGLPRLIAHLTPLWADRLSSLGSSSGTKTCCRWPVEHHRRGHAGEPQARHEGGGLPMTLRDAGMQSLAFSARLRRNAMLVAATVSS